MLNEIFLDKMKVSKKPVQKTVTKGAPRGRVYVSHLPFGFYDEALKKYYSQFGKVTKVRVERSKKTGGFKGYGFVEFESPEVAKIAAESSNNYIIDKKVLKAEFMPPDDQNKKRLSSSRRFGNHDMSKTTRETNRCAAVGLSAASLLNKCKSYVKLQEKLASYGIEYDEVPLSLEKLNKRIEEAEGREKRIKDFEAERTATKMKLRSRKMRKTGEAKGEPKQATETAVNDESDVYKTKNVIDTFEKALDALKNQSGLPDGKEGIPDAALDSGLVENIEKEEEGCEQLSTAPGSKNLEKKQSKKSRKRKAEQMTSANDGENSHASVETKNDKETNSEQNQSKKKNKKKDKKKLKHESSSNESNKKQGAGSVEKRKPKKPKKKKNTVTVETKATVIATDGAPAKIKKPKKKKIKAATANPDSKAVEEPKVDPNPKSGPSGIVQSQPNPKKNKKKSAKKLQTPAAKDQSVTSEPEAKKTKTIPEKAITETSPMGAETADQSAKPALKKKQFNKKEVVQKFRHGVKNIQYKYMT
ncbi:uncharacterized protein LOC142354063 [Convolutriloba macropyga]|uniref:uncharacterized protein LOC142354063 n=1 Tax=Convolutriloba macropyga TaxID=536237 RepID=UPI003F52872E